MKKEAIKLVELEKPEYSKKVDLSELMNRLKTNERAKVNGFDNNDSDDSVGSDAGNLECMLVESINKISNACLVDLMIDNQTLQMEVDCGSSVSVINKSQYFSRFTRPLQKCTKKLIVVNGANLVIEGETDVVVKFRGIEANLKLLVLNGKHDFIPLLGRTWLDIFFSDWRQYFSNSLEVNNIVDERPNA